MSTIKSRRLPRGRMYLPGKTLINIQLSIREALRIQTIVIAHELHLEERLTKRMQGVSAKKIEAVRARLVAAISSAYKTKLQELGKT